MTPQEFDEIVERYLNGKSTPREKKLVEDWFSGVTNDNPVHLDEVSKREIRDRMFSKLNSQMDADVFETRRSLYKKALRYAASLTLLVFAAYVIRTKLPAQRAIDENKVSSSYASMIQVVNETSSNKMVLLKDGSTVLLEPGSGLRYAEHFQEKREVHLSGEAFFHVTSNKEHPFYVYSGNLTTRVVGTSFRVKALGGNGKVTVSVRTGKVSVYSNKSAQFSITKTRKLMLSPNQEAIYDPASEELSQRIVEQPEVIPDVPDLKMKFVNAPAAQIFDVLEKAYGIDIQFSRKSFAGCTLTTDLSEEGFYQRIDALCHALNAEYQVTEASVIINSNGCN